MKEEIQFTINGTPPQNHRGWGPCAIWVLRNELGLTGTKYGCGEGLCAAEWATTEFLKRHKLIDVLLLSI